MSVVTTLIFYHQNQQKLSVPLNRSSKGGYGGFLSSVDRYVAPQSRSLNL